MRSGLHPLIVDAIVGHGNKRKDERSVYLSIRDEDLLEEIDSMEFDMGNTEIWPKKGPPAKTVKGKGTLWKSGTTNANENREDRPFRLYCDIRPLSCGDDETRTRDLRRDRPMQALNKSRACRETSTISIPLRTFKSLLNPVAPSNGVQAVYSPEVSFLQGERNERKR